jgi:hypothetical protein
MAFCRKNIGRPQQFIRIVAGVVAALAGYFWLAGAPAVLVVASGVVFAVTGLVGWCPMCAIAGIGRGRA